MTEDTEQWIVEVDKVVVGKIFSSRLESEP